MDVGGTTCRLGVVVVVVMVVGASVELIGDVGRIARGEPWRSSSVFVLLASPRVLQ